MMKEELYIQVNSLLTNGESEKAVEALLKLKSLGEEESKEYQRVEQMCLDQLYYLSNDAFNQKDYVCCRRIVGVYLSLREDNRIIGLKERIIPVEEKVRAEKLRSEDSRTKVLAWVIISVALIVIGAIYHADNRNDPRDILERATADRIRVADSIAAEEAAAAMLEIEKNETVTGEKMVVEVYPNTQRFNAYYYSDNPECLYFYDTKKDDLSSYNLTNDDVWIYSLGTIIKHEHTIIVIGDNGANGEFGRQFLIEINIANRAVRCVDIGSFIELKDNKIAPCGDKSTNES